MILPCQIRTLRFDAEFFENRSAGLNRLAPTFNTDKMFRAGFKRRKTPAAAAALDVKNPRTPNNVRVLPLMIAS